MQRTEATDMLACLCGRTYAWRERLLMSKEAAQPQEARSASLRVARAERTLARRERLLMSKEAPREFDSCIIKIVRAGRIKPVLFLSSFLLYYLVIFSDM